MKPFHPPPQTQYPPLTLVRKQTTPRMDDPQPTHHPDDMLTRRAHEVVFRAQQRFAAGLRRMPRFCCGNGKQYTPDEWQEQRDAELLRRWRVLGDECPAEIVQILGAGIPGWQEDATQRTLELARQMVERADQRVATGGILLPRSLRTRPDLSEEEREEQRDALRLCRWRASLKHGDLLPELVQYLDMNLMDWREDLSPQLRCLRQAEEILARAQARQAAGGRAIPRQCCAMRKTKTFSPEEWQEHHDAEKLISWRRSLSGQSATYCSEEVRVLLDAQLPGWRDYGVSKALRSAEQLVARAHARVERGEHFLPKQLCKKRKHGREEEEVENQKDEVKWQEHIDAQKLANWRFALRGTGRGRCPPEVCAYLDNHLTGWRKPRPSEEEPEDRDDPQHEAEVKKEDAEKKEETEKKPEKDLMMPFVSESENDTNSVNMEIFLSC